MKRWLSKYLSLLTLIPVVVLLVFIFADLFRAYHAFDQANETIADVNLFTATSQLVHELQKERGMNRPSFLDTTLCQKIVLFIFYGRQVIIISMTLGRL
jgi:cell division protein YceG involved in septum cleavage